ncbi:LysR family transcriptional regulator [Bacillus multifaciens]|uniref:LysR family transcriptional regulator n=1 Tax=Bacillus multifaciens TaxID=3068506 RepID=UPI0027406330|nr:LysR family transcriptional regulator [Bacillus sp. WLY-B-L8]MDP7980731.1 LysR family transcriptional regulator [Bacillus sp. WLY-B-L8]
MAQNKYRVTFISPSEIEQRTIMVANSLPDLIRKVESVIADPNGYFINDKKNNCYFQVVKQNVTFIQYELLFSDKAIHIEKVKHVAPIIMKKLFQTVPDPEIYGLALLDVDEETKTFLLKEMDDSLRVQVEKEIMQKWEASPAEISGAQEILLDTLVSLTNE